MGVRNYNPGSALEAIWPAFPSWFGERVGPEEADPRADGHLSHSFAPALLS